MFVTAGTAIHLDPFRCHYPTTIKLRLAYCLQRKSLGACPPIDVDKQGGIQQSGGIYPVTIKQE